MNSRSIEFRNATLCGLAACAALLMVWPVVELPFNDDWSYAFTVKRLLESGRLVYNGWSSPSIISQAYWAYLWVKLFGFSFNVLRFSTIFLAVGSVVLTYLLARQAALSRSASVFAALMLALSPLFLPLATSFMTDVPAAFCLLLSIYAFVRSAQRPNVWWLIAGAIIGGVGGISRQIDWIAPLVLLPYVALRCRASWPFAFAALITWIASFITAMGVQHWFELQPYAIAEPSLRFEYIRAIRDPFAVVTQFTMILITLVLITLPAGITGFRRSGQSRSLAGLAGLILLIIGRILYSQRRYATGPWMINILTNQGVLSGGLISGNRPDMLPWPLVAGLSVIVFATIAVIVARLVVSASSSSKFVTQPAIASMMLVCVGYLFLLLTRCTMDFTLFDRHLVALIPCAGIPLLRGCRSVPIACWILLGLFGVYSIGSTQEEFASMRARAVAIQRLRDAGVDRTQLSGGFDYDAWTQLLTAGYINDSRIKTPANAFHAQESRLSMVKPLYRIEYGRSGDTVATSFGAVTYFSIWPPFSRQVCIDRIVQSR